MNKQTTRTAKVTSIIDRKIKYMGGDTSTINACIRYARTKMDNGFSDFQSVQGAVSLGSRIIDGPIT